MKIFPCLSFFVFLTCLRFRVFIALVLVSTSFSLGQSAVILTYVGPQLPVSGLPATAQHIDFPNAVVSDGAGGFYLASSTQNRIYRVLPDGRLILAVGIGTNGYSGDGGPATLAQIDLLPGYAAPLAVDKLGNLYIVDVGGARVRKVSTNGIISTLTTIPTAGVHLGMAVDAKGNIYVAEYADHRVLRISPNGALTTIAGTGTAGFNGDGGQATSAQLAGPSGLAVDALDNLYIADGGNHRIRRVTPDGIITTFAGSGQTGEDDGDGALAVSARINPRSIAIDGSGNLYIATGTLFFPNFPTAPDARVRKVTKDGLIQTVLFPRWGFDGDGGPAMLAKLKSISSIAADDDGNLFIADENNHRVRRLGVVGTIDTVAGNPDQTGISGLLNFPLGLALDTAGNLYFGEVGAVRRVSPGGGITTVAGTGKSGFGGDGGPATSAQIAGSPYGLALDSLGNIYFADAGNHRIRKVTPDGLINTIAGNGTPGTSGDGGPAVLAQLYYPEALAIGPEGNLYIAEPYYRRIRMVTPQGTIYSLLDVTPYSRPTTGPLNPGPDSGPSGLVADSSGDLYVAYSFKLLRLRGIEVVKDIAFIGNISIIAEFLGGAITMDAMRNIYATGFGRVFMLTPAGSLTVLAGGPFRGFTGDGGPATLATFSDLAGIAVDRVGNIYVADTGNGRIRKIVFAPRARRRP
ncbi:MAG TPA: NHL repeat-containing protein [Acidobacteriota bacterium]|jgi:sugar lactone lactonase YvrE